MFVCRRGTLFALALSLVLLLSCSFALSAASAAAVPANAPCIVLDAGHGGVDPGVVGRTTGEKESDVNLKIVQKLQKLFSDAGFRVVLTRKNAGGLYGLPTKGYNASSAKRSPTSSSLSIRTPSRPIPPAAAGRSFSARAAPRGRLSPSAYRRG